MHEAARDEGGQPTGPSAKSRLYQLESQYLSQDNFVGRLHTYELQLRELQSRLT
jgi:hypothetical protein